MNSLWVFFTSLSMIIIFSSKTPYDFGLLQWLGLIIWVFGYIIEVISDSQKLRAVSSVGEAFPIHTCANGKAIMANMSDKEIDQLITTSALSKLTEFTISDPAALKNEIEKIRKKGIAFDREEHCEGVCAIGIAIADPYGRNIAISIPIPSVRFSRNRKLMTEKLIEYKAIIEKALGATLL